MINDCPTPDDLELALDEADKAAARDQTRYSSQEVFDRVRRRIRGTESTMSCAI